MTPPKTFQIIKEKTALRCDICHQADMFDLATGTCGRCQPLIAAQLIPLPETDLGAPYQFPRGAVLHPLADFRPPLSLADVGNILREALFLYRRHFPVFLSIVALVEIPLALGLIAFGMVGDLVLSVGFAFLASAVSTVAGGALAFAVQDAYTEQGPSLERALAHVRRRGGGFVAAATCGKVFRWFGLLCGTVVGLFPGFIVGGITDSPSLVFVTMLATSALCGLVSFSRGAFITEIAALEGRSYEESYVRSTWLGGGNWRALSPFVLFTWAFNMAFAALFLDMFIKSPESPNESMGILYVLTLIHPATEGRAAVSFPLLFLMYSVLKVLVSPFLLTTRTLHYLRLRRRAEGHELEFRFSRSRGSDMLESVDEAAPPASASDSTAGREEQ